MLSLIASRPSSHFALACLICVSLSGCSLFETTCEEDDRECIGPGPGLGSGLGPPLLDHGGLQGEPRLRGQRVPIARRHRPLREPRRRRLHRAPTTSCDMDASRINHGRRRQRSRSYAERPASRRASSAA